MTPVALALVLAAAVAHATWNVLAKRASGSAPASFTWLFTLVSCVVCAPLALRALVVDRPSIGELEIALMLGSGLLHVGYFLALAAGYRHADLTLVYPLARGSGPLLATLGAVFVLGEHPSALAWLGVGLIALGILALTGDPRAVVRQDNWQGAAFALLTGVFIGGYTIWDRFAVGQRFIPPVLYFWGMCLAQLLLLVPFARPTQVKEHWRTRWRLAVGIGILASLAYVLVLTALAVTPVSFVAPIRETSVLFASILGARFLSEGHTLRRSVAALAMVGGVVVLALA